MQHHSAPLWRKTETHFKSWLNPGGVGVGGGPLKQLGQEGGRLDRPEEEILLFMLKVDRSGSVSVPFTIKAPVGTGSSSEWERSRFSQNFRLSLTS